MLPSHSAVVNRLRSGSSVTINTSQTQRRGCAFSTPPSYLESTGVSVRDSSVGIATRYGLGCPRSNPGVGEIFRTRPDRPSGSTQPPVQWVPGLSRRGKASGAWR